MGKFEALDELFIVKYYTKDSLKLHNARGGIREIEIVDKSIAKLYQDNVTKIHKTIGYNTRFTLFYYGLVSAFQTLDLSNDKKDIYKHIKSTIKALFDEELKRLEALEMAEEARIQQMKDLKKKKRNELNKAYKDISKKGLTHDDFLKKLDKIFEKYRKRENELYVYE